MKFAAIVLFAIGLSAQAADMVELNYRDQEQGGQVYQTRILVNSRYLRMDEGQDKGDFTLLDRKTGDVVNVQHEQKLMVRLHNRPLPRIRQPAYKVSEQTEVVRPGTTRVRIYADDKLCSETVAARKLFPDAAEAIGQFRSAMAYTQWQTYQNTPEELRQNCDLVHYVWEVTRPLEYGLPMEERDYSGRIRVLEGSKRVPLKSSLFVLPKGYAVIQPPDTASSSQ